MFTSRPVFMGIAVLSLLALLFSSNDKTLVESVFPTSSLSAGSRPILAADPATDTIPLADGETDKILPEDNSTLQSIKLADEECPGPLPGEDSSPSILGASTSLSSTNALIQNFSVQLDQPGQVWVEYHPRNNARDVLQSRLTPNSGTEHQFPVVRLVADTEYCYQVYARATPGSGPVSASFPGLFATGPAPAGLADSTFKKLPGLRATT